jgi:DNA-binding CsgD family transcriptional regulator
MDFRWDENASMDSELPLVARHHELSVMTDVLEAAARGHGEAVLITGEPGIGKTRLLREARAAAEERKLLVLRGRAVPSGGAYRPLVEAFARPAAQVAGKPELAGVRPTLARVLPGWVTETAVLAPMADPAAVLAAALILLLQTIAPNGAALILDDLHWADPDTLSVLTSLADSVDTLPLALILAARGETLASPLFQQLQTGPPIHMLPLRRLASTEVAGALRAGQEPPMPGPQLDQLVAVVDGLPLIMDEFIRQIQEHGADAARLDLSRSTLASAVQLRLGGLSSDCRSVLDALSVIGDNDSDILTATTGLDSSQLSAALHAGLASTLLVSAPNSLGVGWRHILIGEAVRDLLLPLEQQAIACRAADQLADGSVRTDGQLRRAARLYELAGYPGQAAQQLIRAAHLAVAHAALDVAQQDLDDAQTLTGDLARGAHEVLIERIEALIVAGRAKDAYDSGMAALNGVKSPDHRQLLAATDRAAFAAGHYQEGRELLAMLERENEAADAKVAILRAQSAYADRRPEAVGLGRRAALQAEQEEKADLACEALVVAGMAARRVDTDLAVTLFHQAIELSQQHELVVWEVRANAELGVIDMMTDSDPNKLEQARKLATTAGMVGTVAEIDVHIGQAILVRHGFAAAYPMILRAVTQARQLRLAALQVRAHAHLAESVLLAGQPMPGTTLPPGPKDMEAVVAEARRLAGREGPATDYALAARAWLQGDTSTANRAFEKTLHAFRDEVKVVPWWGFAGLLRVIDGTNPNEAFGPVELTGHHANWAARAFGMAVWNLRAGQPADAALAEAEYHLRHTPYWRHLLRTVIAPVALEAGMGAAEGWLREADAFCSAAGERELQRRVRQTIAATGRKVPRAGTSEVAPHLAKFGITAREAEILRLINAGMSNTQIAEQLFISVRTVETHVSSMLQKTGAQHRDQLPVAIE